MPDTPQSDGATSALVEAGQLLAALKCRELAMDVILRASDTFGWDEAHESVAFELLAPPEWPRLSVHAGLYACHCAELLDRLGYGNTNDLGATHAEVALFLGQRSMHERPLMRLESLVHTYAYRQAHQYPHGPKLPPDKENLLRESVAHATDAEAQLMFDVLGRLITHLDMHPRHRKWVDYDPETVEDEDDDASEETPGDSGPQ